MRFTRLCVICNWAHLHHTPFAITDTAIFTIYIYLLSKLTRKGYVLGLLEGGVFDSISELPCHISFVNNKGTWVMSCLHISSCCSLSFFVRHGHKHLLPQDMLGLYPLSYDDPLGNFAIALYVPYACFISTSPKLRVQLSSISVISIPI